MGRAVIAAVAAHPLAVLTAAFEREGSVALGRDAGELAGTETRGVTIGCLLDDSGPEFDVLVDFTRPDASMEALAVCLARQKAMVIGTTGFSTGQQARIEDASSRIPIVKAGNFSLGVNLCLQLLEQAAAALGDDFDVEIVEAHHKHKVDAPSGTALMMGEAVARGAGKSLADHAVYERFGHTGARRPGTIGFSTIRGGDVVGDHTVTFFGEGERVEITHKASSRLNFANGAVRAAVWTAGQTPGLFSMRDVLGPKV